MRLLSKVFTIDVCAFAIMGNHYHLVLRIDASKVSELSDQAVAKRWRRLFGGDRIVQRYLERAKLDCTEEKYVASTLAKWRSRLVSLSWYMRSLNEYVARRANAEDECKGRFWEGRFKSQALLDDQALLACMAYVDLNPVRAGVAATPEASDFTSIHQRIQERGWVASPDVAGGRGRRKPASCRSWCPLLPFATPGKDATMIPFGVDEYLVLVDWIGRVLRPDKSGVIPSCLPPILQRLGVEASALTCHVGQGQMRVQRAMGTVEHLRGFAKRCGRRFTAGIGVARALFGAPVLQPV